MADDAVMDAPDLNAQVVSPTGASKDEGKALTPPAPSTRILTISAISGIVIAGICLALTAAFLFYFLNRANQGITAILHGGDKISLLSPDAENRLITSANAVQFIEQKRRLYTYGVHAQMDTARIGLVACGVFAGVAFGFLGFSLFLLGIKGEIELKASNPSHSMEIKSLAPGAFVILTAALLAGFCIFQRPYAQFGEQVAPLPPAAGNFGSSTSGSANTGSTGNSSGTSSAGANQDAGPVEGAQGDTGSIGDAAKNAKTTGEQPVGR
ncbi:MAG: hypothetical protein ACO1SV_22805 [Fimbriimonas sp.]